MEPPIRTSQIQPLRYLLASLTQQAWEAWALGGSVRTDQVKDPIMVPCENSHSGVAQGGKDRVCQINLAKRFAHHRMAKQIHT